MSDARDPHMSLRGVFAPGAGLWIGGLIALALVARAPLLLSHFQTSITPDTPTYFQLATQLSHFDGIGTDAYRTLGYPMFLVPWSLLPGDTEVAATVAQHLLGIALVVAIFVVADNFFSRPVAALAGGLAAIAPPMLIIEQYLQPDLLFAAVILAGATTLTIAALPDRPSLGGLALTGVIFGLATHVKPTGQIFLVVAPLVLVFATRSWSATWRGTVVTTAAMLAVVLPWVVFNWAEYGHPTVSAQGGQALFLRAFDEDRMAIPTDSEEGRFAAAVFQQRVLDPSGSEYGVEFSNGYSYVFNAFNRNGYSAYDAADTMGDLAKEAIRDNPGTYLKGTITNLGEYVKLNASFGFAREQLDSHLADSLNGVPTGLTRALGKVSSVLAILLLVGLIASPGLLFFGPRRSRIAAASMLAICLSVAVAGALTSFVLPRYAAEIAPLQWMLGAAGLTLVVSVVAARVRGGSAVTRNAD